MSVADLTRALNRAAAAVAAGDDDGTLPNQLERSGLMPFEVDLSDSRLLAGDFELSLRGYGLRMLRHGSNPGARLELKFGGTTPSKFFAPGQVVRGGFETPRIKLAKGSARVGKATFVAFANHDCDLAEDLIISAIGPVDLLGATDANGDLTANSFVTVAKDTDPSGANPVGSFDGSGWELLRVMVDGLSNAGNFTTSDVVFWQNPYYSGTNWLECGTDGRYSIPDTDTSGGRYRSFTVGWAGRGLGYPAVRNLLAVARTGLSFCIQGLR